MDHPWHHVKDLVSANEPTPNVHATVDRARREIRQMSPKERLPKAGVLSKDFWLADVHDVLESVKLFLFTYLASNSGLNKSRFVQTLNDLPYFTCDLICRMLL